MIAALRMDQYNYPDDTYFTYQLIGTYKFNDKHMVRALTSKANRGAFMADIHADLNAGGTRYVGSKDIILPTWFSMKLVPETKSQLVTNRFGIVLHGNQRFHRDWSLINWILISLLATARLP